jgi:type I restriction enzyme R subunit
MAMDTPSFKEDHISQIPALQLLMKMGYNYLTPDEALAARGGRSSNVLLEGIMKEHLREANKINYKGKEFYFTDANINTAVLALRDLPIQDGYIQANIAFYDLITLGKSLDQAVLGDKKSFTFHYIDWKHPENNVYHVTEEYNVLRTNRTDTYRPDIVLFINGIPIAVIECKSPKIKDPLDKSIEQHLRNQQEDGIRGLYHYSNILIGLATEHAKFATTGTSMEFWSVWREAFKSREQETAFTQQLTALKNKPLPSDERTVLFKERFKYVLQYFNELEANEVAVTEQDKLLYCLCRPERILDLMLNYIVYDDGEKKIARYQQYFAIKDTLSRIQQTDSTGKRTGGVIWHTQGSGKSLTMVMLAEQISTVAKEPQIIMVTDRIDLDDQISGTFKKCGMDVKQATSGRNLVELLNTTKDIVITTVIHKFESAVNQADAILKSNDIFILVDEGHRTQYGKFNTKMRKMFPNACFIAFTGTPLMKAEKNTANRFGGIIGNPYTINDAVKDKAVVPLLYEGRMNLIDVNAKPLDTYFSQVSEPLSDYGKGQLKKKFSRLDIINKADLVIYERSIDIVKNFCDNFQLPDSDHPQKALLVAPNKISAIKYRDYIEEFCNTNPRYKVNCEVLISAPDMREGEEDAFEKADDKVKAFWNAMMDRFKRPEDYDKNIINAFKKKEYPEMLIVVDKLLTGFDAPCATVLYLTRPLKEHTLLQAIARVNRLYPGKDYGYIIDYFGNLKNLDEALTTYSGLENFDEEDLKGAITAVNKEVQKLPQAHSEVWDIFKTIKNRYDATAYKNYLFDDAIRYQFYEKLSAFGRILKLAYTTMEYELHTPDNIKKKHREDYKFFLNLREVVKYSYSDDLKYEDFEPQVQKLVDKHITTEGEIVVLTNSVNIFDKELMEKEVERIAGKAAKADHIASKTIRSINLKMNEDPVFYKRLSQLIKETIDAYHAGRLSEVEYLDKVTSYESNFTTRRQDNIPSEIADSDVQIAFFNQVNAILENSLKDRTDKIQVSAAISLGIDNAIKSIIFDTDALIVDWEHNSDIQGKLRIALDDFLFDAKATYGIEMTNKEIDLLEEECLKIAKARYK